MNYQTDVWYKAAEKLFNDGNINRAKDIFESIVLIRPTHNQAINNIKKINEIYKKQTEERYFRGLGFYSQRNLQKALEDFQSVIDVNPDHEDAKNYLARIEKEIEQNQQRVQTLFEQAKNYEQRGSLSNARQRYQQILSINPMDETARRKLSVLNQRIRQYTSNQYRNGERAFKNNDYTDARRYFQSIISMQSNHAGARRYLEKINELTSDSTTEGLQRAETFLENKNWPQALVVLDSILTAFPDNQDATVLKEEALFQIDIYQKIESAKSEYLSGRYIQALSIFNTLLEKDPNNQEAIELKALCQKNLSDQVDEIFNSGIRLYTDEKYELAIAEFEKILNVNDSHKGAQEYKQRAQERLKALDNLQ